MPTIKDIKSFGAIAAEDDDLARFFVSTPVFQQVRNGDRQIVVGRKGSGKSALYLALMQKANSSNLYAYFASGLTFSDYPWALHYKYARDGADAEERFTASWEFLVLLEVAKKLLADSERKNRGYSKDAKKALDSLETFLKKNYGTTSFDYKKTFPNGPFKVDNIAFNPQVLGNGLGGIEVEREAGSLGETLSRLNEWLRSCLLTCTSAAPEVLILFDELDTGFDPQAKNYADRIIGLLIATRRLARFFREAALPFKAVAFLRSDVYEHLHFGDKNKITENNVATLFWNDDVDPPHKGASLKQLIDHRVRVQLQLDDKVKNPWDRAFDDQLMKGTQHKFQHMSFRGFLRPRDLIKFCNVALESAHHRIDGGDTNLKIINDDINSARRDYSLYLIKELDDEIAPAKKEWKRSLELLRKLGFTRWTKRALSNAISEHGKALSIAESIDDLLQFFYAYSIVGFLRVGRGGTGAGYYEHFRYMDETIRFDVDAPSFLVHRGLREALDLQEKKEPHDE